jgi:nucleoside-diphosphate-sugar epimerase
MKILITGDEGFVGREFHRQLHHQGHITGIDIKSGHDCRDYFRNAEPEVFDLVIHLAAIVGGRLKIEGDPLSVATDLSIDAEMFNWALRTKQKRIVYFSSSAAYPIAYQTGGSGPLELSEHDINLDAIKNPDLTYGWAKLTGEYLAQFANEAGIKTYVFRPFSGYGVDQDLDYPFPSFIDRAKRRLDPFEIWGDGNQVRDFIHISDIVRAVMAAVDQDYLEPLNLGCGRATSFNELAHLVTKEANYKPIFKHIDNPVGVSYRVANTENMFSVYVPRVSLEEGIRKALWT